MIMKQRAKLGIWNHPDPSLDSLLKAKQRWKFHKVITSMHMEKASNSSMLKEHKQIWSLKF